jgi:hypothetical protein
MEGHMQHLARGDVKWTLLLRYAGFLFELISLFSDLSPAQASLLQLQNRPAAFFKPFPAWSTIMLDS